MSRRRMISILGAGALGVASMAGAAGAVFAAPVDGQDGQVDVTVDIDAKETGALTMGVAAGGAALAEVAEDGAGNRVFEGMMPTVTVTDTRTIVPEDMYWYVTGQAGDFTTAGGETIAASQLGWAPEVLTDNDDQVIEGDGVGTSLDGEPGMVGDELMYMAWETSGDARPLGSVDATAKLTLKTEADQAPGSYRSTVTLTLWEDEIQ